jgi:hypothetical protein
MQEHKIEFDCWEHDKPYDVQLEPWALVFTAAPQSTLKFVAMSDEDFTWAVRLNFNDNGLQLFPECLGDYSVQVYINDVLEMDV